MNKSSQSKNLVIQLVLRLDRARGSTVFGWRLGLIKMRPCLKSKTYAPFSNRPKNPALRLRSRRGRIWASTKTPRTQDLSRRDHHRPQRLSRCREWVGFTTATNGATRPEPVVVAARRLVGALDDCVVNHLNLRIVCSVQPLVPVEGALVVRRWPRGPTLPVRINNDERQQSHISQKCDGDEESKQFVPFCESLRNV